MALKDFAKVPELVKQLPSLPEPAFSIALEYIGSDSVSSQPEVARSLLWENLTDFIVRHRRFASAAWAMQPQAIAKIESAAIKLAPKNPRLAYRRLFSGRDFDLFGRELRIMRHKRKGSTNCGEKQSKKFWLWRKSMVFSISPKKFRNLGWSGAPQAKARLRDLMPHFFAEIVDVGGCSIARTCCRFLFGVDIYLKGGNGLITHQATIGLKSKMLIFLASFHLSKMPGAEPRLF